MPATRILTTHSGSLPRPKALVAMLARKQRGEAVDDDELEGAIAAATEAVVEKQIQAGIDIGNDGEMGRESFFTFVRERLTGFGGKSEQRGFADMFVFEGFMERMMKSHFEGDAVSLLAPPRAEAAVTYKDGSFIAKEVARFKKVLDDRKAAGKPVFTDAFLTAPSPGIVAAGMQNAFYPTMKEYVDALADALRNEYKAIIDAGFILQVDAPDLAMERHTLFASKPLEDFLAFIRTVIDAQNRALEGFPRDRVRLHVCYGNYQGPHHLDVPLKDIWPEIVRTRAGTVVLSLANPQHAHEWRCFSHGELPTDVSLVVGSIDTTTSYVEHPMTVADTIERVAKAVGDAGRIQAGTDCGFETSAGFGPVVEGIVWAKLRALSDGAKEATKRLF